jgi:hypothetical protein
MLSDTCQVLCCLYRNCICEGNVTFQSKSVQFSGAMVWIKKRCAEYYKLPDHRSLNQTVKRGLIRIEIASLQRSSDNYRLVRAVSSDVICGGSVYKFLCVWSCKKTGTSVSFTTYFQLSLLNLSLIHCVNACQN